MAHKRSRREREETSSLPPRLQLYLVLLLVSFVLALAASSLALGVTLAGGVDCHAYPSCLFEQPSWSVSAHLLTGAALGVALLACLVVALLLRTERPRLLLRSAVTVMVVVIMGGIGAGLSMGALPEAFLLVQTLFLFLLLWLLTGTYRYARHGAPDGEPRRRTDPTAPVGSGEAAEGRTPS